MFVSIREALAEWPSEGFRNFDILCEEPYVRLYKPPPNNHKDYKHVMFLLGGGGGVALERWGKPVWWLTSRFTALQGPGVKQQLSSIR